MESSLEATTTTRGTKRPRPIDREYAKCKACRLRKVKCLPTDRDWTKGEKCRDCDFRKLECGPNERANSSAATQGALQPAVPEALDKATATSKRVQSRSSFSSSSSQEQRPTRPTYPSESNRTSLHEVAPAGAAGTRSNPDTTQPLSPTNSIASSLVQLGELRITFHNVARRLDIVESRRASSLHDHVSKAESALDTIADHLKSEYCNVLRHIFLLIEDGEIGAHVELVLRRLLGAVETFVDIAKFPLVEHDVAQNEIRKLQCTILARLIATYEAQNDTPEAELFAYKLEVLLDHVDYDGPDTTRRYASFLAKTSRRMRDVLKKIHIPAKYRTSLHLTDADPFPSIHRAMFERNRRVVRHLCETTRQVLEEEDILERGVLHVGAETSSAEVLPYITDKTNSLLKKRDKCWNTPLCIAARHSDFDFFSRLVELSTTSELCGRDGESRSILTIASEAGHLLHVQLLLKKQVSPNDDTIEVQSPLHAAAAIGHFEICRELLEYGAYVNWYSMGKTPTQLASENNHRDTLALLQQYENCPGNLFSSNPAPWESMNTQQMSPQLYTTVLQPSTPQQPNLGYQSPPDSFRRDPIDSFSTV